MLEELAPDDRAVAPSAVPTQANEDRSAASAMPRSGVNNELGAFRRARHLDRLGQSDQRNTGADGHGAALQRGEKQAVRELPANQYSELCHRHRVPESPLA